jgi:hypothetical protein
LQSVICGAALMTSLLVKRSSHLRNEEYHGALLTRKTMELSQHFVAVKLLPLANKKIGCANPTKDYFGQILQSHHISRKKY